MSKTLRITLIAFVTVAVFGGLDGRLYVAELGDVRTAWDNFTWQPYLHNGELVYDHESPADPSKGVGDIAPEQIDIASGADDLGPGGEPSVYFAHYYGDPANPSDDFYGFRVRLNADPKFQSAYGSRLWTVIIDIDGDGYKEFSVVLDGWSNQTPQDSDLLKVFYNNLDQQEFDLVNDLVDEFEAWNNENDTPNNHTRIVDAPTVDDLDEVYLDFQVPITAFKDKDGNPQVFPGTVLRLFWVKPGHSVFRQQHR